MYNWFFSETYRRTPNGVWVLVGIFTGLDYVFHDHQEFILLQILFTWLTLPWMYETCTKLSNYIKRLLGE